MLLIVENQTYVQFIPICSLFPGIIKIRKELTVLEATLVFIVETHLLSQTRNIN